MTRKLVEVMTKIVSANSQAHLKTGRAYAIKETLKEFWDQPPEAAEAFLQHWYFWATHSRLDPIGQAAKTIKAHWAGVLQYTQSHRTNAVLEGINSLVQAAKARALGHRNVNHFSTVIYLMAGKLSLPRLTLGSGYPTLNSEETLLIWFA